MSPFALPDSQLPTPAPDLTSSAPDPRPAHAPAHGPAGHGPGPSRDLARWGATFAAYPLAGLTAHAIAGPASTAGRALAAGLISGAVLGAAQAWGLRPHRLRLRTWVLGSALAFGLALSVVTLVSGAGDPDVGDVVLQGLICGAAVGGAQGVVLAPRLGALALAWPALLAASWALGWAITAAVGVDLGAAWTLFGSSGALAVTVLTSPLTLILRRSAA